MSEQQLISGELVCRTDQRRGRIRAARLNGIDGVEVADDGVTLTVTFLGKAPHGLCPENFRIDGGRRITGIEALEVSVEREDDPELDDRVHVTLDRTGDTSRYRLSVVETDPYGRPGTEPYEGFDQRYFTTDFRFRTDCPSPFDCAEGEAEGESDCPDTFKSAPVIDYTARDYETLRQLVLDRLRLTTPDWVERNPADLGMTLVEMLAYTADQISYQQDAVATEAYLDTARKRVSVRRHVRLIDYPMHDGCSARAFVSVEVASDLVLLPGTFRFAAVDFRTYGPRDRPEIGTVIDDRDLAVLDERGSVEVFEPVGDAPLRLRPEHNAIRLWTWGDEVCALPKGATSATLRDEWADDACETRSLKLAPGDLLLFEEVKGPRTGTPGDQDPGHRQAVRLTSVTPAVDQLDGQPVLEVTWAQEDALTFPLCLSTRGGTDCAPVDDVSVARGNVALVDHGRSLTFGECPEGVPETVTVPPVPAVTGSCEPPAFGCADHKDSGNVTARTIEHLMDKTKQHRALTADDIRELFEVVGEEATVRAGLGLELAGQRREKVVPGTVYAQAEALRTLLAQSVYPGIRARFRPVLHRSPVAQTVPFPRPELVAAGQAERLAGIRERVRARLVELWRSARDHDGLSEAEISELTVLFGLRTLEHLELHRHPVRALRELLHREDRLLAPKLRRLDVLSARARAGAVLDARIAWEIAHSWGPAYAAGLHPDEPVLHGPAASLAPDPRAALPAVRIEDGEHTWVPRRDLLDSGPRDRHFVGELEDDGRIALRFGDGRYGARPEPGSRLTLHYRLGGGTAGNVGAEAINHLVLSRDAEESDGGDPMPVAGVRNPLPAIGGAAPESVEQVRQLAPLDLKRTRQRAVTAADYAELASALPGVQRAAAEIRWTGSVQEAHVAIDAARTGEPTPQLLDSVAYALESYRRIGHDLVVEPARTVPLDIEFEVCAAPGHQHGRILAELTRVLGSRRLSGGRLGFFHPDALTFGEPVRLSRLTAVAAAVPGVESVRVTRLQRLFSRGTIDNTDNRALEDGVLRLGPLEIAVCDNDPDRPENGRLVIDLGEFGGAR
ncbi:putative baseplate assembly protein [Streptomyces purpurogeneiscleroticus]|uniref:putative baseplate assembly protein n=1 Tax=Streptomyces purpurogeneiscleroticus TaxID=68259 RepID=UPI001CBFB7A4|nr:putative baseplate assembly protein [Streptomyces purpurogeneiscleroticus]MBZ4015665.1 putative baseplate assembly protein [Streptomyces purpurogeneiscleroticus]